MDDFSKELGWGHRLLRHNTQMMEFAEEVYGDDGGREVALHIACDMKLITGKDLGTRRVKRELITNRCAKAEIRQDFAKRG
jgi:hypothetical protein